jgi:hypothetical protein
VHGSPVLHAVVDVDDWQSQIPVVESQKTTVQEGQVGLVPEQPMAYAGGEEIHRNSAPSEIAATTEIQIR